MPQLSNFSSHDLVFLSFADPLIKGGTGGEKLRLFSPRNNSFYVFTKPGAGDDSKSIDKTFL